MTSATARRIDVHTHFLPDAYRAILARHGLDMIAGAPVREWSHNCTSTHRKERL